MRIAVAVAALVGSTSACQTPTSSPQPAQEPAPAATQAAPATLDRATVEKALCLDVQGPCVLTDLKAAGDTSRHLYIAEVAYVANPDAGGAWKSPNSDNEDGCNKWELVLFDATAPDKAVVVSQFCNDGHGASGVGEDFWEVKDGRLALRKTGGSNWRWGSSRTIDLANRTTLSMGSDNYFATNPNAGEQRSQNFETFVFSQSWSVWPCGTSEDNYSEYRALSIPSVALPSSFVQDAWKQTGFGSCATALDATASTGWVTHGDKSTAADTAMKVVAAQDTVFVEVLDDQIVGSTTGKWIHADHLEVWASPETPTKMQMECVDIEAKGKAWQWGVDALTGKVEAAYGKPPMLVAERQAFPGGVRFKVKLPADTKSVTLVYSDSDDGKSQERLLATSEFKFGRVQTMGELAEVNAQYATCALAGGKLERTLVPSIFPVDNWP